MNTLKLFLPTFESIPVASSWYLAEPEKIPASVAAKEERIPALIAEMQELPAGGNGE